MIVRKNRQNQIAWFYRQKAYTQSLSVRQYMVLKTYIRSSGGTILNAFRRGECNKAYELCTEQFDCCEHRLFPLYYQVITMLTIYYNKKLEVSSTIPIETFMKDVVYVGLNENDTEDEVKESTRFYALCKYLSFIDIKDFWKECILMFGNELDDIVLHAPKTTKPLTTWIDESTQEARKTSYMFVSIDGGRAHLIQTHNNCQLKQIVLASGTPCLLLEDSEIIIPVNHATY